MVNVKELAKESMTRELVKAPSCQVDKEYYEAVNAVLKHEVLVQAAYKEAYEQITKDSSIKTIVRPIHETVVKKVVGEIKIPKHTSVRAKICRVLSEHPNITSAQVARCLPGESFDGIRAYLSNLRSRGIVESRQIEGGSLVWKMPENDELKELLPKDKIVDYMG